MTNTVWPINAVAGAPSYTGKMARQATSAMLGGATAARPLGAMSGVRIGTPTTTVTATSTLWTINPHAGILDVEASAIAGAYLYAIDTAVTGAVTAADATNPRVDIVWVRVDDPAESDGSATPALVPGYTAGTPAVSPAAPATPARCMVLATISVPKSGGGSPSVVWVAPYATAAGGIVPVPNATVRGTVGVAFGSPATPVLILQVDTGVIWKHDGTTAVQMAQPLDDTGWITPTLLNSWVNFSVAYDAVKYRRLRGVTYITGVVKGGTTAAGSPLFVLPAGFRPHGLIMRATITAGGAVPLEVDPATGNVQQGAAAANATWTVLDMSFPADA